MYLKKLELSGFKSFAKNTVLEFPSRITAVVGPNGTGKSNIVESIRWVLGEQSMKTLRGKRGEDLIWNGSPSVARSGKASVSLIFDNKDKKIPVDFDEVNIERKIFRDGLNEYSLNGSQVRLKDIVEILAKIGLGETKHNIIGQGEVDRILLASSKERKSMLEEAMGLRIYQLKKAETLRKLAAVENNVKQGELMIREITPHLKFLRQQSEKAQARDSLEAELHELERIYFSLVKKNLEKEKIYIKNSKDPLEEALKKIKEEVKTLRSEIAGNDSEISAEKDSLYSEEMARLEVKISELERDLGRIEGKIEAESSLTHGYKNRIDHKYLGLEISSFIEKAESILRKDSLEAVKSEFKSLIPMLEKLIREINAGEKEANQLSSGQHLEELNGIKDRIEKEIAEIKITLTSTRQKIIEAENSMRQILQKNRERDRLLRSKQDEERDIAISLERIKFEDEKILAQEEQYKIQFERSKLREADLQGAEITEGADAESYYRKIERLRLKLEEVGGIDAEVIKEYQDLLGRHTFLNNEINDLKESSQTLENLIHELDEHIREDFAKGFSDINMEFKNFFSVIFGGGSAGLKLIKLYEDEDNEGVETDEDKNKEIQEGVEISIDLPRKRIKSLSMLSGGERALVSIILLFAIASVNPPPFLVLDETDAALDEANSHRYAAILNELSARTQLLLVTHNRETMKCAGILFGVTMGEDGSSRLLSLKLEEAEVYTNR